MKIGYISKQRCLVLCASAILALASVATAQQEQPHGDLAIPCEQCHTAAGWTPLRSPLTFDHADVGWELVSGHSGLPCASCHRSSVFSEVPIACADCHEDPHRGELGFECESCHSPDRWDSRLEIFHVHQRNLMPLLGAHALLDCESCHANQEPFEYATTPLECESCHRQDYLATTQPDHQAVGFPLACEGCHLPLQPRWTPAIFDHPTSFALVGGHGRAQCADCHSSTFAGTPTDCAACHRDDYAATTDPNHSAAGFPLTCDDCHGVMDWLSSVFDHALTTFPLAGAHRVLGCDSCHANGFAGTPSDCVACHRSDYDAAEDPNHADAGFPLTCEDCHSDQTWEGAQFSHASVGYRLRGAHTDLDCDSCHADGFAGTPRDCVGCHRDDYDATSSPNHVSVGFPLDCADCHGQNDWNNATFDHDVSFFPIYSGKHRGKWADCSDCHVAPNDFKVFDCLGCHGKSQTDKDHSEVGGYSYDSKSCYRCHPTGEEDD